MAASPGWGVAPFAASVPSWKRTWELASRFGWIGARFVARGVFYWGGGGGGGEKESDEFDVFDILLFL